MMLLSGGEIFSDPLSEGKRRIVWVLFIVQKGVGERSNKCIECTRHVRFLPRGVFYYFMGGRELHKGVRFPSNENSTRLAFSMQMKFMTRIYWIVTAIKRFSTFRHHWSSLLLLPPPILF